MRSQILRSILRRCLPGLAAAVLFGPSSVLASSAKAQGSATAGGEPRVGLRGFVHGGVVSLAASDSFEALTGDARGQKFGGGAQVTLASGLFFQFGIERYRKTGSRAFVFDGEVFPLGVRDTVTVTPITVSGGYRFHPFGRVVPYVGGGLGSYGFKEESDFADPDEIVDERFTGYHVLGGAEVDIWRGAVALAAAAEVEYATVPDALATGGLSQEFGEDNLGGTTIRFKFLVGRW